MDFEEPARLHLPSFLRGSYSAVLAMTREEGQRCAVSYLRDGSFPAPRVMREVHPGEVVLLHEVADFHRDEPAWRLYLSSNVLEGLCEALDWRDSFQVSDLHESWCRTSPWGALAAAVAQEAPRSAARTALRLRAVLRFWTPLASARYCYKSLGESLSLEGLLAASHDGVLQTWDPTDDAPIRTRLERAAERMAHATRDECVEVIVRGMSQTLPFAKGLRHRSRWAEPSFLRQRVAALDAESFERLSGACPSDLLERLYDWEGEPDAT
ncbi:MAG: hypothetical protein ABW123_19895 [Cystobacter sp.]